MTWRILKCAGAEVAFLIGSGFASGQEILQFFASYGPVQGLAGWLITAGMLTWLSVRVMTDGRPLQNGSEIFRLYCGPLGPVFQALTPLFLLCLYVVMISGAGALMQEAWGVSETLGRGIMLAATVGTVLLGLERLTDVVGTAGPVIILLTAAVGFASILRSPEKIPQAAELVQTLPAVRATGSWWLSGMSYAAMNGFTLMPFLTELGRQMSDRRESRLAGWIGAAAFSIAALLLQGGILACWETVYNRQVPSVQMAQQVWPGSGTMFSIVMLMGIYTTATPALWSVCSRFSPKNRQFQMVAAGTALVAALCGGLPFVRMIQLIYPCLGYCGMVVFVCAAAHTAAEKRKRCRMRRRKRSWVSGMRRRVALQTDSAVRRPGSGR